MYVSSSGAINNLYVYVWLSATYIVSKNTGTMYVIHYSVRHVLFIPNLKYIFVYFID